jgi:hypothetical protein
MRKKSEAIAMVMRCLFIYGCFSAAPIHAAVVNLTFTEDIHSFSSTWSITDNGGADFSGTDSVTGTFWGIEMVSDATPILQDTVAHLLGVHGEGYTESSLDYGALPAGFFSEDSWVNHDGHRDEFSMTSTFVGGGYNVTLAGLHSVPIPAAVWLFGSGLGLLGWIRRRNS